MMKRPRVCVCAVDFVFIIAAPFSSELIGAVHCCSLEPPGPGTCKPANQTVPGSTVWYWCGFYATHATVFNATLFNSNKNNSKTSTIQWMRKTELEECVLPSPQNWANCAVLPGSKCSKKDTCAPYLWALSFPDDICLVVANVKSSSLIAQVQVFNFYNSECMHARRRRQGLRSPPSACSD